MNNSKKTTAIRLDIDLYNYIKNVGLLNNRSISGQANWTIRVTAILQEKYPDLYAEIAQKLNKAEY
ncbi:MAG: ParD-like family protein [Proteobacteria bacterium]|jgi:hypothetical protein|nr:ParD-like family protein [Pseudomonadota bacterium]